MAGCPICDEVSPKRVRNIDRRLRAGKQSIQKIAERYHVEVTALQRHLQCLQEVPAEDQELQRTQHQLTALIAQFQQDIQAGEHYKFDPEAGIDGRGIINQMIAAMREHRETILARKKLRSSDELYRDLRDTVVDPMINALTVILVTEAKRLRDDLFDVTKEYANTHPRIKHAVDEMLQRTADRFTSEALNDIQEKVVSVTTRKVSAPATH
jgi:hypothetical protein